MRILIEISVSTLVDCTETLNELIQKPLKIRTAYKIARLAREIQKELELFETTKVSLVKKYGELDENGKPVILENGNYKIKSESSKEFLTEYQDMLTQKISLNIEPLSLEELEEERFTPQEISSIIDFIKE